MENPDKARERLEEILSQREYQVYYEENRNFLQIAWERLSEWFFELLAEWLSGLDPSNAFTDTLLVILMGVVILLAFVVVFFAVRAVRRKQEAREYQPFQSADELEWSVTRHVKEAEKQADSGNYSLGIRHQFLALLLYFHDLELLKAYVWKTNWDYFAELQKKDKQRAEAFYELARVFDEAVYGEREIEQEEYERYRKHVRTWMQNSREKDIQEN
jgi:flagellar biosynthesis/type III secretory pathway M-ring protein FliF/YscJ